MNILDIITRDTGSLPPEPIRAIGIDLGTTNSAVAEVLWDPKSGDQPRVRCLPIKQETDTGEYINQLIPSVVAIVRGRPRVGEGAKRMIGGGGILLHRDIFYNTKNDMGLRRTYHQAPVGHRSAREIAAKVLAFLSEAAQDDNDLPPQSVTITVPASFQMAQRNDTLEAAGLANLEVVGGDLLDEPVAAFIDYLVSHQASIDKPSKLVVFDFGGGTCDIAVFKVDPEPMTIAALSVSRYHRLGGSDIDAAIVHQILIPQLIERNGVQLNDVTFSDRKLRLEPALLGIAETLKTQICEEIDRLQRLERYHGADKTTIVRTHPGPEAPFELPDKGQWTLERYALSAADLEAVLGPFLDLDKLDIQETEYYNTWSIFAPLQDALDRADIFEGEVDHCLLVGGSTLIPQMRDAIQGYLPSAQIIGHQNPQDAQVSIARGAAYNALSMALHGRPVIQPVAPDDISILTGLSHITLIPRGTSLPYPSIGWSENLSLATPSHDSIADPTQLRVEIVGGDEKALIYAQTWEIPPTVEGGTGLRLRFRYDENRALHFELSLAENTHAGSELLRSTIENPLSHVVNPNATREVIDQTEEAIRVGHVDRGKIPATYAQLARDYAALGQIDKAIDFLTEAIKRGGPKLDYLTSLGIQYQAKGDLERARMAYSEAAEVDPSWSGAMFNLALLELRNGSPAEALQAVQVAIAREENGPNFVLAAEICQALRFEAESHSALSKAFDSFTDISSMGDWELAWYRHAAQMSQDPALVDRCDEERRRRRRPQTVLETAGELPVIRRSPFITRLSAQFIVDPEERVSYINRETHITIEREKPLLYIADTADGEMRRLAGVLRERLRIDRQIAVLLPTKRQVNQFIQRLQASGFEFELEDQVGLYDDLPKLLTYDAAAGQTFDSVLLPQLVANSFRNNIPSQTRQALFDAINLATKWVYLSTTKEGLLPEFDALLPSFDDGDLIIQLESPDDNNTGRGDEELDLLI